MSSNASSNSSNSTSTESEDIPLNDISNMMGGDDSSPISSTVTRRKKLRNEAVQTWREDANRLFSQVVNLNEEGIFHEPTCPICSSPLREESEKLWASQTPTKDWRKIVEIFSTKSSIKVGRDIVENHMRFHADRGVKELQAIEYISRLQRMNSRGYTTLAQLDLCYNTLNERLLSINSITPDGNLSVAEIERIKSQETVKLIGQILQMVKLKATIMGELKETGDMISIPVKQFTEVLEETILSARTDREREFIMVFFEKLKGLGR